MEYIRAFLVGGIICILVQILMDHTTLQPGRIMVLLVIAGVILGALGIYKRIEAFGGCVAKNGSVVSTDVEDFDTAAYKQDDLQSYVDKSIDDYNKKNDGSIKLKKLTVEKKKASLTMSYASTDEYTDFNGTKLFSGTIAEALAAGYDFKTDFAAIDDGKAKKCESSEFLDENGYKVVIYEGRSNLHVKGKILYASVDNVKLVDDNTVAIGDKYSLLASQPTGTESVTEGTEAVKSDATEGTENGADDSVSDDDILNSVKEDNEVTFDFDSDEDNSVPVSYVTYVIYK